MRKLWRLVKIMIYIGVTSSIASIATPAKAGIIYDNSPDTTGLDILVPNFLNLAVGTESYSTLQWFGSQFNVDTTSLLTGVDIFGINYSDYTGIEVIIRIWADLNNQPGQLIFSEVSAVSIQDSQSTESKDTLARFFAPVISMFLIEADTKYWISMAGVTNSLNLATFDSTNYTNPWVGRQGDYFRSECFICGDIAMRVHGDTLNSIPLPTTAGVLAIGIIALRLLRRKQ